MAVRLSVVMVHSTPATPSAERVAQGVVGELIGLSGIDLILVAPLDSLGEASTDRLTLSSISGDIAVLDWRSPQVMHESLSRLGVDGQRTQHPADPATAEMGSAPVKPNVQLRKLYFFNLSDFTAPEAVVSSIAELNAARAVQTFSLAPILKRPASGDPVQANDSGVGSETLSEPKTDSRLPTGTSSGVVRDRVADSRESESASPTQRSSGSLKHASSDVSLGTDSVDQDLDALIDELDQLDP